MANKVPLPTRGQPIDSSFLYKIAEAINSLVTTVDSRRGKAYIKPTPTTTNANTVSVTNASMFASVFPVEVTTSVETTATVAVPIKFTGVAFQAPPVITATPITIGTGSEVNKSASVTIQDLTVSGCTAYVKFSSAGSIQNLHIHVIAIGYPVQ